MGNALHSRTEHRIFVKDNEKPGETPVSTIELGDFGKNNMRSHEITA